MPQHTRSRGLTPPTTHARHPPRRHLRRGAPEGILEALPDGSRAIDQGNADSFDGSAPEPRTAWRPVTAALACLLLGSTVSLSASGLIECLSRDLTGYSHAPGAVIAGVLFALALGVRVPQSFAVWVCALSWRRFVSRGKLSSLSDILIGTGLPDRSFYWLALSVVALLSGVVMALLPISVRAAIMIYDWTYSRFVWSTVPLLVLQTATVFLAALLPLMTVGFAISCAHRVSCRFGQWENRATGWLVVGAGGGLLASKALYESTGRADLTLVAAALPTLLVSLLCAGGGSLRSVVRENSAVPMASPLPMWRDRWPMLLRGSIVLVGCGGAWAISVWASVPAVIVAAYGGALPVLFMSFGIGSLAGSRAKRSGLRSIGGFGVACSAGGVIIASATFLVFDAGMGLPVLAVPAACLSTASLGFAMGYGHQTLLHRVASRSSVGATILGRLFVGSAVMTGIAGPLLCRVFPSPSVLAILALLLTALGGALIIHEPGYSPRTRRVRLCAVFATLAGMIALSPQSADPRAEYRRWHPPDRAIDASAESGRFDTVGAMHGGPHG